MDRVLRGVVPTLQVLNYDSGGNLADVPGAWSAQIRDSAGAAVGGVLNATNPSTGVYQVIAAAISVLDTYTVSWTAGDGTPRTTYFEVVGGFHFTIAELRAFDSVLANAGAYPAAVLQAVREAVEDRIERVCHVAFVPRGRRAYLSGTGTGRIFTEDLELRSVVSAKIDGVALTSGELADLAAYPIGMIERKSGSWTSGLRNVEILYEHGLSQRPEPIFRAALALARHAALKSPLETSDRATAQFTDAGAFRLSIAGRDGPTGLPEVDAVLGQFGHAQESFA